MIVPSPYDALLQRISVTPRTQSVCGSPTAFWDYGDPESATTIVMVHGFRGDHHGLEPVVAHLPGLRIVSPDLPGFGASAPLVDIRHDLEGYAHWLCEFMTDLAPTGRVVILGHSFGSIVVAAALARGLRVDDVILVNPIAAPALSGPRGVLTRLAIFYYWAAAALPERLGFALLRNRGIVRIMSITMTKTREPLLRRWIHNQHDRYFSAFADRNVVLDAFRASVGHDVSEFADDIPERTLLIAAEKDDITPLDAQYRLQALFAHASLAVIGDVGHLIHYETPEPAAAEVQRFLGLQEPA